MSAITADAVRRLHFAPVDRVPAWPVAVPVVPALTDADLLAAALDEADSAAAQLEQALSAYASARAALTDARAAVRVAELRAHIARAALTLASGR